MKTLVTKNNVLLGSIVGLALSYVFANPILFHICRNTYTWGDFLGCTDKLPELVGVILMGLSPAILLISLLIYKMRDEVFESWKRLSYWFIPISTLIILSAPTGGGGWGISLGNTQEHLASIFPILYFALSLGVITWKWFALRKTN